MTFGKMIAISTLVFMAFGSFVGLFGVGIAALFGAEHPENGLWLGYVIAFIMLVSAWVDDAIDRVGSRGSIPGE